jgi:hypothetical protein
MMNYDDDVKTAQCVVVSVLSLSLAERNVEVHPKEVNNLQGKCCLQIIQNILHQPAGYYKRNE